MDCSGAHEETVKDQKIIPSAGLPGGGDFFVEKIVVGVGGICYNLPVTAPILVTGRG